MKRIIITNHNQIEETRKYLVKTQGNLFNTDIQTLDMVCPWSSDSPLAFELKIYKLLQTLPLKLLKESIKHPSIIKRLISFSKELKLINVSDLPRKSELDKEIYECVECITSHLNSPTLPSINSYEYNPLNLSIFQSIFMQDNLIPALEIPDQNASEVYGYYASNRRQEIESIAQDILKYKNQSIEIYVPQLDTYYPLIESVFNRYNLDIGKQYRYSQLGLKIYTHLLKFTMNPTIEDLKTLVNYQVFTISDKETLEGYLNSFSEDFNHLRYEPKDAGIQEDIDVFLTLVDEAPDAFIGRLIYVYNLLQPQTHLDLRSIKHFIETKGNLYDYDTVDFFLEHIQSGADYEIGTIRIKDYSQAPILKCDRRYCIDLSVSNYPGISSNHGILDETYLGNINGYPLLQNRVDYTLAQKELVFKNTTTLILSYHLTSYEGKSIDLAFDIKRLFPIQFKPWPIQQQLTASKSKETLDPSIAKALFLKEGKLHGSVSSLQLYAKDPMAYFIQYGLGLMIPRPVSFDAFILGNLNHKIMETGSLETWIDSTYNMNSKQLSMIQARNKNLMTLQLEHESMMNEDTDLTQEAYEKGFRDIELFPNIVLRGIIDRIDSNETESIIIDYKSSDKSLSPRSIQEGHDLQLITYLFIAERLIHKSVIGAFYYSLASPTYKTTFYSYNKAKGIQKNEINEEQSWKDHKKLSGWFFEKRPDYFNSPEYFKGLFLNKDGELNIRGKVYDKDKIRTILGEVYHLIYSSITQGILEEDLLPMEFDPDLKLTKGDE